MILVVLSSLLELLEHISVQLYGIHLVVTGIISKLSLIYLSL